MAESVVSRALRAEARRILADESRPDAERREASGHLFLAASWIEAMALESRRRRAGEITDALATDLRRVSREAWEAWDDHDIAQELSPAFATLREAAPDDWERYLASFGDPEEPPFG